MNNEAKIGIKNKMIGGSLVVGAACLIWVGSQLNSWMNWSSSSGNNGSNIEKNEDRPIGENTDIDEQPIKDGVLKIIGAGDRFLIKDKEFSIDEIDHLIGDTKGLTVEIDVSNIQYDLLEALTNKLGGKGIQPKLLREDSK